MFGGLGATLRKKQISIFNGTGVRNWGAGDVIYKSGKANNNPPQAQWCFLSIYYCTPCRQRQRDWIQADSGIIMPIKDIWAERDKLWMA